MKAAREVVDAVLRGQPVEDRELEMDGRSILINARPLPSGGAVLVIHDLTELRRLEVVRRDFVANVSHELKTPLTSISGYAETLLTDTPEPETTRRFLCARSWTMPGGCSGWWMTCSTWRGSRRAVGSRSPSRWMSQEAASGDVERAGGASRGRRGANSRSMSTPARGTVMADADALRQVLTNLLDNSLRYTPRGRAHHLSEPHRGLGGMAVSVARQWHRYRP